MKIQDVYNRINELRHRYGEKVMNWDVFVEQCSEYDKAEKRKGEWKTFKDGEGWEYFESAGFYTIDRNNERITINVNH